MRTYPNTTLSFRLKLVVVAVSAAAGLWLASTVTTTTGAYTDQAAVQPATLGNGNKLELEISGTGDEGTFIAYNPDTDPFVDLSLITQKGKGYQSNAINSFEPSTVTLFVRLPQGAPTANIIPSIMKPTTCVETCEMLFNNLMFVLRGNENEQIVGKRHLTEFNSTPERQISKATGGTTYRLLFELYLDPSAPPVPFQTETTGIWIRFDTVSVAS